MASIVGAILLGIIIVLAILLALGLPLGELSMGGKYKIIPPKMRIIVWIMVAIQIMALLIILQTSGIVPLLFSVKVTKIICFVFAGYLSLNSIMNLFSYSRKEKLIITPLSIVAAICFWITAFSTKI
ncbi:hypothetical protein [Anaerosporobacter sp.]|uniref:hypothetical protein n=1 Tax=Anaerosporobacter sp. TaxID=1872529 RepID=UPI00286F29AA|nr:hypothetical protein [Anaerosporobacter sp.]